jgi:hypothetical protein
MKRRNQLKTNPDQPQQEKKKQPKNKDAEAYCWNQKNCATH